MEKGCKKTVLFVLDNLGGGGAERVVQHLIKGLDNFQPAILLINQHGNYMSHLPEGIKVHTIKASRARYSLPGVAWQIRKIHPNVVFSTKPFVDQVVLMAIKLLRDPPFIVLRSPNFPSKSLSTCLWPVRALAGWSYRSADTIISLTDAMKKDMVEFFGVAGKKVEVINNPVDIDFVQGMAKEELDNHRLLSQQQKTPPIIIGMGAMEEQKGFTDLLEAFAVLREKVNSKLVLLGQGEKLSDLRALTRKLNVAEDVYFEGFVPNPYKYLAKADLFVLSSLWEGFPNALVEAMTCGTPVVATKCPSGPEEIIDDEENGLLVPVGDRQRMVKAMERILKNPNLAEKLATGAQRRVQDFRLKKVVGEYEQVFREITGQ